MRGAIADDFTGATDLAGNWRARGLHTAVYLGIPGTSEYESLKEFDALVLAQKIRSTDVQTARQIAREAGSVLLEIGCTQIYDKYCSTFDSTQEGNIGPIADELFDLTGAKRAVVVPSFPDAGRTVYQGHLFVLGELLDESPMKNHPLNPMRDSSVIRLLAAQTNRAVGHVSWEVVSRGSRSLRDKLERLEQDYDYLVVDALTNEDLVTIAEATIDDKLMTGGSGLALGLAGAGDNTSQVPAIDGQKVILSGSASAMTQRQVRFAMNHGPSKMVDPQDLLDNLDQAAAEYSRWVTNQWGQADKNPPMLYTVESPADTERAAALHHDISSLFEEFFGILASRLAENGATQFIVAGGETSGAICQALKVKVLELGNQLGPGVSWILGRSDNSKVNLVLKSGNFGTEDLFVSAWGELNE
ncbi:3-oxo-tetronate kinase [Flaviflexus massiliensis]|uniref:3-oxo-tetronate kinase n=1 Tax=Flaviflexus massiliensis TaxID=1522309 RepID=UPI0006D546AF|nr:3-oxo-tetronate kinase [Flaviflexus massiliensis]